MRAKRRALKKDPITEIPRVLTFARVPSGEADLDGPSRERAQDLHAAAQIVLLGDVEREILGDRRMIVPLEEPLHIAIERLAIDVLESPRPRSVRPGDLQMPGRSGRRHSS
jgi:hypothetical protein